MFNPEKLLGGLVSAGLNRKTRKRLRKTMGYGKGSAFGMGAGMNSAIGFGALGVAMAAFDHFVVQKQGSGGQPNFGGQPQNHPQQSHSQPAFNPPPVPPPMAGSAPPPPPPGAAASVGAAPEKPSNDPSSPNDNAVLLIRAMIASAYADGILDADERGRILGKLDEAGLTDEERAFVANEFLNPAGIDAIAQQANTPELAQQVYIVALLAVDVDTDQEFAFLKELAEKLSLSAETVQAIHAEFEAEPDGDPANGG